MGQLRAERTEVEDGRRRAPDRRGEHGLLALQRAAGNAAVRTLVEGIPVERTRVQRIPIQRIPIQRIPVQRTLVEHAAFDTVAERDDALKAVAEHRAHHAELTRIVDDAARYRGTDELAVRLANSAKLVQSGAVPLFALSAPHDQDARRDSGLSPWIESRVPGTPNSYHREHDNRANLSFLASGGLFGVMNAFHEIRILFKPGYTRDGIRNTLRHEVQHVVDFHAQVDHEEPKVGGSAAWSTYATEYRAHYFQEAPLADGQPVTEAVKEGQSAKRWATRQQLAVFRQIYTNYRDVREQWDTDEERLKRRTPDFQNAVLALVTPKSINPLNSPVLHRVYDRILDTHTPLDRSVYDLFRPLDTSDVDALRTAAVDFAVVARALGRATQASARVESMLKGARIRYT